MLQRYWDDLDPRYKRLVVMGGSGMVLVGIVAMFSGEPVKKETGRQEPIRHILTDSSTRAVSMDSLAADIKLMKRENDELRQEVGRAVRELQDASRSTNATEIQSRQIATIRKEIVALQKENKELKQELKDVPQRVIAEGLQVPAEAAEAAATEVKAAPSTEPENVFAQPTDQRSDLSPQPRRPDEFENEVKEGESSSGISIVTHVQTEDAEDATAEGEAAEDPGMFLPAGSILTGVLINGMDAPTGQNARKDPFPSIIRIQKEAILPNRFRADIRECFLIVSGYGDLSSERAFLRGETLSCVTEDGGVIDSRLDGYLVGEDGKTGIRGRLISKQGQIIAQSMMAGFMSGIAQGFDVNPVPVINTNPGTSTETQYQSVFSDQMLQGAAVNGASKALDRVAQFYIDMAENIFPVIEVDAGRQVDIIVTRGTQLKSKR